MIRAGSDSGIRIQKEQKDTVELIVLTSHVQRRSEGSPAACL